MCPFLSLVVMVALNYDIAMKKRFGLVFLTPFILASCGVAKESTYSSSTLVYGSFFSWKYVASKDDCSKDIYDLVNKLNYLADPYNEYMGSSNLYRVNHTHDEVTVDADLFDLVKTAVDLYEKTEGNFNPYMGKITSLWKTTLFGAADDLLFEGPSVSSIEDAKALIPALLEEVKGTSVELDETKQTIKRIGDGYIDLGGLTKGYSVERAELILEGNDVKQYLINGGQSSLGLGQLADNGKFKISLMYSETESENRFSLGEIDTSTSAVYEQFVTVEDVTYSHIINPHTGMPLTDYSMAFLVGEDSALLDAFSTSCMIAGPEKSEEWAKKYNFTYSLYKDEGGYTKLVAESEELSKVRI